MDFKNIDEGHPAEPENPEDVFRFYYSREERLKNAPQSVKDFYAGKMAPKKGLFKVLVATPGNRFMLSSIVVFVAFIWIFSFFSSRNEKRFLGTECELTAFSFEDSVYASLEFKENPDWLSDFSDRKKTSGKPSGKSSLDFPEEKNPAQIPLRVLFQAYDSSGIVADKSEIFDVYSGRELFIRTKFSDYDIIKVSASVQAGTEEKDFEVRIQRR